MTGIREYKDQAAAVDEAARRDRHLLHLNDDDFAQVLKDEVLSREPRWFNVFGEEVDLDDINKEYALNILLMVHARRVKMEFTRDEMIADPLIQKLRDVVLNGREKNWRDKIREHKYNVRCRFRNLPYRA